MHVHILFVSQYIICVCVSVWMSVYWCIIRPLFATGAEYSDSLFVQVRCGLFQPSAGPCFHSRGGAGDGRDGTHTRMWGHCTVLHHSSLLYCNLLHSALLCNAVLHCSALYQTPLDSGSIHFLSIHGLVMSQLKSNIPVSPLTIHGFVMDQFSVWNHDFPFTMWIWNVLWLCPHRWSGQTRSVPLQRASQCGVCQGGPEVCP